MGFTKIFFGLKEISFGGKINKFTLKYILLGTV
jgi:hypothetical protein